jgi:hypothetical protein
MSKRYIIEVWIGSEVKPITAIAVRVIDGRVYVEHAGGSMHDVGDETTVLEPADVNILRLAEADDAEG